MKNKFKLASFAFVTLFVLSLSLGAIHSVRALTPVSTVYLTPNATGPLVVGTTVQVNITGDMLGTSANSGINGWDLVFDDHDSAGANLNPLSIAVSPNTGLPSGNLLTPFGSFNEPVNCVNAGVGFAPMAPGNIGCGIRDGPGIVHTAYASLGPATPTPVSGLIGVITYSVSGPSADTISIASPCGGVGTNCDTITDGSITPVPHVTLSAIMQTASSDYAVTTNNPLPFNPNGTATGAINVASLNAFAVPGLTLLSTDVYPSSGLTFSCTALAPLTVSGTSSSTCSFKSNTPGFYVVTANVTDSATGPASTVSHLGTLYVRVGDFSINEAPSTIGFPTGNTGTATVTLRSVNGFAGPVNLKNVVAPAGLTITCPSPVSVPAGGSVNSVCTLLSSTPGTYSITTTGYYNFSAPNTNLNINRGVSFGAAVWDFSVSAPTTTQTMQAGYAGTAAVALTPRFGWNRLVTLSASSSPVGVTFAATANPCTTNQVPSNIARNCVLTAAKAGTYTVTITATCGAAQSCPTPVVRTATFTMVVNPDFTVAAAAVSPASILVGAQGTSTITVTNHNFTGTISFTVNLGTPAGLNCGTTPAPVTFTSALQTTATTTLSCTSATPTTYTGVIVTSSATGAGIVAHSTAAVSFKFISFTISANPATIVNAHPGMSNSTSITVVAKNGFTGTITLTNNSTSFSPAWTVACTLNSIVSKGGTNSTSCAITAPSGVSGTFHIGFTGTISTFSNSTTVSVTVAAATQHMTSTTISCHPTTFVVNNSTSCTVTVTDIAASPTTPSGTVGLSSTGTGTFTACILAGTGAVATCQSTYTPSVIGTGSHTLTANYPGDAQTPPHTSSSGSTAVTVTVRTTTTTISCHPITIVVNNSTSCTVTVSDTSPGTAITPSGTVGLTTSGTGSFTTCTLGGTGATATCSSAYTPTTTGSQTLTANYGGDTNHSAAAAATTAITVNLRATSITISCHPTTIVVNNSTSCAATVLDISPGTASTPTGTVTFSSTGAAGTFTPANGQCTLNAGSCYDTFTPSATGTSNISASYGGNTAQGPSGPSNTVPITVNPRTTSATISCHPTTIVVNNVTSCTVTVTDTSPGTAITPSGTVALSSSGTGSFTTCTLGGTGAVATCSATYTPTVIGTGSHLLSANYGGDSTHSAAPTATTSITVTVRTTTTIVACTSPVTVGSATPCNVTVTDNSPGTFITATGTVGPSTSGTGTFTGTCTLSGTTASAICVAQYTPSGTAPRTDTITANNPGDANHSPSSGQFSLQVNPQAGHATSTTISCHPTTIVVNNSTSCTVTVTDIAASPTTPSGTVTFTSSGTGTFTVCNLAGAGASATCQTTYTPSVIGTGSHTLTANYPGDAQTPAHSSSSNTTNITVTVRNTTTTITCHPTSIVVNNSTSCTITVSDTSPGTASTPTGSITLATSGTGTFSTCTFTAGSCTVTYTPTVIGTGTHTLAATYNGDASHGTSQGQAATSVTQRSTTASVVCTPSPVTVNSPATCIATVQDTSPGTAITSGGTVAFSTNATAGSFTIVGSPCNLSGSGATATCQVTYTPTGAAPRHDQITGTYSGDTNHSTSQGTFLLPVTGSPPSHKDFTLSVSPASVTLVEDSIARAFVTLHSNGFNGSVDLSVKISPSGHGLTAHLMRIHVRLGPTSTQRILLIVSGDEANAGDYTITVTGMSGSLSHSASLKVTVTHPGDDERLSPQQFLTWFLLQTSMSRWD